MRTCVWCGRPCDGGAACLRCAPNQGGSSEPDYDEVFDPDETQLARLDVLRATLAEQGIPLIDLPPDEPEWFDLNEQRFLAALHDFK